MGTQIEEIIYNGVLNIVGDPIYIGILVLGFFTAFVILQGTSMPQKVLIVVAASFLASAFVPFLGLIAALISAFILYAGTMRFVSK